jgi:adenosylcobinamide-GDP ribazoletransferase
LAAALPAPLNAALLLSLWILLSGALHLDGFLDACDGLFGGHSAEQRLEIMRDEAIGAFAFAGGAMLLLTKFGALQGGSSAALLLAPTLGRWAISLCIVTFPYARAEGLGSAMKAHAGWRQVLLATTIAATAAWLAAGGWGLLALATIGLFVALLGRFVLGRIPGFTGDLYGAACESSEALVLLFFAAVL